MTCPYFCEEKVDTLTMEVAEKCRQKEEERRQREAAEAREKAATDKLERARLGMLAAGLDPDAD